MIARYATRVNGLTDFFLTKLDVLTGWEQIPVCVAYEVDGQRFDEMPMTQTDFHHAKPIYEYLPGWDEDITGARSLDDLPQDRAELRPRAGGDVRRADLGDRRRPGAGPDPAAEVVRLMAALAADARRAVARRGDAGAADRRARAGAVRRDPRRAGVELADATRSPARSEEMRANVERTLERQAAGRQLPFAIVVDGVVAGSTSFYEWDEPSERIEIGYTLLGTAWWRTAVNTSCKLLLMGHAFDSLGYGRVALRTDHLNTRSQAAIARIGGVREGVLRRHVRRPDGTWRDTVYFSILRDEWPGVRERLTEALERR